MQSGVQIGLLCFIPFRLSLTGSLAASLPPVLVTCLRHHRRPRLKPVHSLPEGTLGVLPDLPKQPSTVAPAKYHRPTCPNVQTSPALDTNHGKAWTWWGLLKSTFNAWSEDKALRLSAALAYYSVFSIAPLIVITIAMAGLFLDDEAATGELFNAIKGSVGPQAAAGVQEMVESASKPKAGIVATVVGSVTLLLGASGVLGQLKDALNTIWEVEVKKGAGLVYFVRSRFLNFGMVLVIGLLLLISLMASSWLATIGKRFHSIESVPVWVWSIVTISISIGVAATLFAMLFKFLPDAKIGWKDVWLGAALTAVLFEIGKAGLGWYLGREGTADAYGSAGSVVLLILWVYYAACILLFGAEFTQVYATARGRDIEPSAVAVSTADKKNNADADSGSSAPSASSMPAVEWTPSVVIARSEQRTDPIFTHRLFEPLLRYLEGRLQLLSIEAKESLVQGGMLLIIASICGVGLFVGWALLAVTLIGLLTEHFGWYWVTAVGVSAGLHLAVAAGAALLLWKRSVKGAWFAQTIAEFRKDRAWLKGHPKN